MLLNALQFSLNVILPTLLMMLLGVLLRHKRWIDDQFCQMASKVIFNVALPATLFLNVVRSPLDYSAQRDLILSGVLGTILLYLCAEWWAAHHIRTRSYRAIFTQGTFRSNAAILGLALGVNAYGSEVIGKISVFVAVLVILFNILGVITLTKSLGNEKMKLPTLLFSVLKNPLIVAVSAGILVNKTDLFSLVPHTLVRTGDYLSGITLPLALICTGASLNFKQLTRLHTTTLAEQEANRIVFLASTIRLILAPLLMLAIGKWGFDLDPISLGILFLTTSSPVASAVYAMVRHYGGDATATANLIGLTTLGSIFTTSLGLVFLRQFGVI